MVWIFQNSPRLPHVNMYQVETNTLTGVRASQSADQVYSCQQASFINENREKNTAYSWKKDRAIASFI